MRRALFAALFALLACAAPQTKRGAVFFEFDQCIVDVDEGPCLHHYESIASGGAQQRILLRKADGCGGKVNASSVRSTDEHVFTAALADNGDVIVTTAAAGAADLELLDGSGGIIDAATLTVEDVASIPPLKDPSGFQILAGNVQTLHFEQLDARAITLVGTGGIAFSWTGPIARDADPPPRAGDHFDGTPFTFHGDVGDATLAAAHGAASWSAPIRFVDLGAVATVAVAAPPLDHVVEKGTSLVYFDSIGTDAAGKAIFGTRCAWSDFTGTAALYDDASLETFELQFLEQGGTRRDYFSGHGTATCTIGAATATVTIP
ncbi:MAG TPA: hypothetical protein VF334_01155 [Polyangia bacterium]